VGCDTCRAGYPPRWISDSAIANDHCCASDSRDFHQCRVVAVAPNREATLLTRLTLNSTNAHTTYARCSFGGGRQRQFARVLRFCAMEAVIEAGGRSNPALNRRGTALVSTTARTFSSAAARPTDGSTGSLAHPVARCEQPIANEPIESARPGLVGIAAHIGAHGRNGSSR